MFTAEQLQNISNAALDFYVKGPALSQTIQAKPLFGALTKASKTFPGGKENISIPVKGDYVSAPQGFSGDQQVGYKNPAKIKRVAYPWKELHEGITFDLTELKKDGISVVDSSNGKNTVEHSDRELTRLTDILEDKMEDMSEGWARGFNTMLWLDGSQDSLEVAGIQSIVLDDPTTGTTGGLDRAATTWWRNRALTGVDKITSSTANQTLTKTLRGEVRQLTRYGGKPNLILCGSGALEKLEAEIHEKGTYTQQGFVNNGKNDIGMSMISMRGVGDFMYDPTLDDLDRENFIYILDTKHLKLWVMEGEDKKVHNPSRPYDRYVVYRAMTWTGGLAADQLNCHGVYEVA